MPDGIYDFTGEGDAAVHGSTIPPPVSPNPIANQTPRKPIAKRVSVSDGAYDFTQDALAEPSAAAEDTPQAVDQPSGLKPEGTVASFARAAVPKIIPGVMGLVGGVVGGAAGALVVGAEPVTIPAGAIAGGIAAESQGGKVNKWLASMLFTPEHIAAYNAQNEANAAARPLTTAAGEMAGGTASMFTGSGAARSIPGLVRAAKLSEEAIKAGKTAAEAKQVYDKAAGGARVGGALLETGVAGAVMTGGAEAQNPDATLYSTTKAAIQGGVTMAPLAFVPHAKSILGSLGWRAPTDAAILAVNNALWDHFVNGAPLNPREIARQAGKDWPTFMVMNAIVGVFGRMPLLPRAAKALQDAKTPADVLANPADVHTVLAQAETQPAVEPVAVPKTVKKTTQKPPEPPVTEPAAVVPPEPQKPAGEARGEPVKAETAPGDTVVRPVVEFDGKKYYGLESDEHADIIRDANKAGAKIPADDVANEKFRKFETAGGVVVDREKAAEMMGESAPLHSARFWEMKQEQAKPADKPISTPPPVAATPPAVPPPAGAAQGASVKRKRLVGKSEAGKPAEPQEGNPDGVNPVPGTVFLTATGRKMSSAPIQGTTNTDRMAHINNERINSWLIENAIAEADSRGDEFNGGNFKRMNVKKLSRADVEALNMYLWDKELAPKTVQRPVLTDLAKKEPANAAPASPRVEPDAAATRPDAGGDGRAEGEKVAKGEGAKGERDYKISIMGPNGKRIFSPVKGKPFSVPEAPWATTLFIHKADRDKGWVVSDSVTGMALTRTQFPKQADAADFLKTMLPKVGQAEFEKKQRENAIPENLDAKGRAPERLESLKKVNAAVKAATAGGEAMMPAAEKPVTRKPLPKQNRVAKAKTPKVDIITPEISTTIGTYGVDIEPLSVLPKDGLDAFVSRNVRPLAQHMDAYDRKRGILGTINHGMAIKKLENAYRDKLEESKTDETAVAKPATLRVMMGGREFGRVSTFQEASEKWSKARDQMGVGARDVPPIELFDADGKVVAHIAYNGRVFEGPAIYSSKDVSPRLLYENQRPLPEESGLRQPKMAPEAMAARAEADAAALSAPERGKLKKQGEARGAAPATPDTPMMRIWRQVREQTPADHVVLLRIGDFYEAFFDDAKALSEGAGVALTKRNGVPMAGVPYHSAESYLKKMVAAGKKVALVDRQADVADGAKGIVRNGPSAAREPWEMTRAEYTESVASKFTLPRGFSILDAIEKSNARKPYDPGLLHPDGIESVQELGFVTGGKKLRLTAEGRNALDEGRRIERDGRLSSGSASDEHVSLVEKALAAGRDVPSAVLADYPELKTNADAINAFRDKAMIPADWTVERTASGWVAQSPALDGGKGKIVRTYDANGRMQKEMGVATSKIAPAVKVSTAPAATPMQRIPKRNAAKNAAAAAAESARAEYFTPGNIVGGLMGHDKVISYQPTADGKPWSVTVQAVVKRGSEWIRDPADMRTRTHMTEPDKAEMAKGPVVKAATIEIAKKYGGFPTEELRARRDAVLSRGSKFEPEKAAPEAATPEKGVQDFGEIKTRETDRGTAMYARGATGPGLVRPDFDAAVASETKGMKFAGENVTASGKGEDAPEWAKRGEGQAAKGTVTPEQDREYMAHVAAGRTEDAQRMVDEAARAAGYNVGPVWHGGADGFTVFDWGKMGAQGTTEGKGFYFSNDRELAKGYADRHGGRLMRVFLRGGKRLDGNKLTFSKIQIRRILQELHRTSETQEKGSSPLWNYGDVGYEGLPKVLAEASDNLFKYSEDDVSLLSGMVGGGADPELTYEAAFKVTGKTGIEESEAWGRPGHEIQVATSQANVKLADPITRDDQGRVIPLSERFNPQSGDIRFMRDADGTVRALTVGNKSHFFLDRYDSSEQLRADIREEAMHRAVNEVGGAGWAKASRQVYGGTKALMIANEIKRNYGYAPGTEAFNHELVAKMVRDGQQSAPMWRRVVDAVVAALRGAGRGLGLDLNMSDAELRDLANGILRAKERQIQQPTQTGELSNEQETGIRSRDSGQGVNAYKRGVLGYEAQGAGVSRRMPDDVFTGLRRAQEDGGAASDTRIAGERRIQGVSAQDTDSQLSVLGRDGGLRKLVSLAGKGAENGVVAEVDGKNRQDAGANDGEVAGRGSSVIRLATRALSAVRSSPGEYKNLLSWTRANYGDSYDPALSDHENAARALAGIGKRPGNLRGVAGVAFQRFRTAMDKSLKFGTDEESKKQTYKGVIYEGEGSEAKVLQRVSEEATRKMGTPVTLVPVRRDSLMFGDAGLGVLSEMERVFGKQIIFARETQERKSKTSGFSSESYNDALIVNADTPRPHLQVVGHELLHSMQRDAPDLYNQFIKAIEPEYKNLPLIEENVRKINATGGAQTTMDEEMGELPANIMGSEMLRPELWDKLKVRNPSIFGKVADYAVRWMGQLKDSVRDFLAKRPHAQWFINDIDATRNHIAALLSDYGERRQLMKRTETAQGRVPIVTLAGNMTLRTAPDTPRQREMDKAIAEVSTPAETTTAPAIPEHAPEVSGTTWHDVRRDPGKEFSIRDKPAYESEREFLDDYRENGKHDAGETVSEFLARRFCGGRSA